MRHDGAVIGALLIDGGRRILSWSWDKTLRLWDAATGAQIGPAMRHDEVVMGALLLDDGRRILSWSYDKTLRLWDAATGRQIGPAMRPRGRGGADQSLCKRAVRVAATSSGARSKRASRCTTHSFCKS
jgi:WD40 repeat protein